MKKRALPHIMALYVVVFVVGVVWPVSIYKDSSVLHDQTIALMDEGISINSQLASLRSAIATQESILYEYFATLDHVAYNAHWEESQSAIEAQWAVVRESFPGNPRIAAFEYGQARVRSLNSELGQALQAARIDWDSARAILGQISQQVLFINTGLTEFADEIQARMHARGGQAHDKISFINETVIYYGISFVVVALLAGYFLTIHLTGVRERRRLAMFVERNPSPVLRLKRSGEVDYFNPGAWATLMAQGATADMPLALLPADNYTRLSRLIGEGTDWALWQYVALERNYEAVVHYLKDSDVFHVYLRDVTDRITAERRLEHMAFHDQLTDLPNRRQFVADIQQAVASKEDGVVFLVSIERMQRVVDSVGHDVADRLFQVLAKRLQQVVLECSGGCQNTSVYRYEGEIFGILLTHIASTGMPSQLAMELIARFNEPLTVDYFELFLGVSVGSCHYPADTQDAVSIISKADQALQQAKMNGGGFYVYEPALSTVAKERLTLENHLRHALERGELELAYQPQVALNSGQIVSVEVLLRWRHTVSGLIPPERFIPIAEETGLILPIGEWMLRTACLQAQAWRNAGLPSIRIAINLSVRQFISKSLIGTLTDVLTQTGFPPQDIELEITESVAMDDVPYSIEMLRTLKALGVGIALDDFGTGYSSLAYLRQLPLDKLKIDRSFVYNLENDQRDATLVRSVVDLGHSLNLKVIAEGVETQAQLGYLRKVGCEEAQGYYFSRPVSADAFEQLLQERMPNSQLVG